MGVSPPGNPPFFLGHVYTTLDLFCWHCYSSLWTGLKHNMTVSPMRYRNNVAVENLTFLRALQYIAENGCKANGCKVLILQRNAYVHLHRQIIYIDRYSVNQCFFERFVFVLFVDDRASPKHCVPDSKHSPPTHEPHFDEESIPLPTIETPDKTLTPRFF